MYVWVYINSRNILIMMMMGLYICVKKKMGAEDEEEAGKKSLEK